MVCRFRRDSISCGTQENDLEPPGTEGCLTKAYGKAAVSRFGRLIGADWTLS